MQVIDKGDFINKISFSIEQDAVNLGRLPHAHHMPVILPTKEIVTLSFIIYPLGLNSIPIAAGPSILIGPFTGIPSMIQNVPHIFNVRVGTVKNPLVISDCQIFLIRSIEDDERVACIICSLIYGRRIYWRILNVAKIIDDSLVKLPP